MYTDLRRFELAKVCPLLVLMDIVYPLQLLKKHIAEIYGN